MGWLGSWLPGGALVGFFQQGGTFMYLILLLGAVAAAVSIERFFVLYMRSGSVARPFIEKICSLVRQGQVDQALNVSRSKNTPLSRILQAGLGANRELEDGSRNAMEERALIEVPEIQDRTSYLGTIAQVATLLGLLGTIVGLMQSFSAVGGAASEQRAMLLAAGISTALNTTALGLIVAVPSTLAHSIFLRRSERLLERIDEASFRVINLLTAITDRRPVTELRPEKQDAVHAH